MTWIVSDSEGERREKAEMSEDGLAVFELAVGDDEKVMMMLVGMLMMMLVVMMMMMTR